MKIGKLSISSKNLWVLLVVLTFAVFSFKSSIFIDPDFGWHLKMGELILKQGIPETDPFSYTMPNFPFVDHEWLTNIIIYSIHQIAGMPGLILLFTGIGIAALLVVKPKNSPKLCHAPFLLAFTTLLPFWGIRPQMITWLFTAIFLQIIGDDNLWRRWKWLTPLFFLIWANLHGGFAVGLTILFIYLVLKSWTERKILLNDSILALLCLGVTLINPYGVDLWIEVWRSVSDSNLRGSIIEWTPLLFRLDWALIAFLPLAALSGVLVYRYRSKFTTLQIYLYGLLLLAGISSQRHMPLWALMALSLTIQGLNHFHREISLSKVAQKRFNKVYTLFFTGIFLVFVLQSVFSIWNLQDLSEKNFYPQQAVRFLEQYPAKGRLFSSYNWGGYLIWKLPEQKVFVDGRMPSWRWKPLSSKESSSAFDEYNQVVNSAGGLDILDKYQVQLILWPTGSKKETGPIQKLREEVGKILARFSTSSVVSFEERLKKNNWQRIYQDSVASVFERPKE